MASLFRLGQLLRGQNGIYTISQQLQETVWLAKTQRNQAVIVKSVYHFRLQNERDVLKRFQCQTPFIRPLLDEIVDPSDPPAIILKHLDDHLLNASVSKRLTSQEIRYIARRILEALKVLHENGFVHTGKNNYHLDQMHHLTYLETSNQTISLLTTATEIYALQMLNWPTVGVLFPPIQHMLRMVT